MYSKVVKDKNEGLENEMRNIKKTLSRFGTKCNERCSSSKLVEFKMEKFRGEQDSNIVRNNTGNRVTAEENNHKWP